jgi:hypothetical protein
MKNKEAHRVSAFPITTTTLTCILIILCSHLLEPLVACPWVSDGRIPMCLFLASQLLMKWPYFINLLA